MIFNRVRLVWLFLTITVASIAGQRVQAGPIADLMARHRSQRQMKIPPISQPFTVKPVKDISPSSLSDRFKKRFSMMKPMTSGGLFSSSRDSNVAKTSR